LVVQAVCRERVSDKKVPANSENIRDYPETPAIPARSRDS